MISNDFSFPSKNRSPKRVTFFDEKVRAKSRIHTKSPILSAIPEKTLSNNPSSIVKLPKIIKADRTPQKIRVNSDEKLKILQIPEETSKIKRNSSGDEPRFSTLKNLYVDSRKNLSHADSSFVLPQSHLSPAARIENYGLGYSKLARRYSNPKQRNNIMDYSSQSFMPNVSFNSQKLNSLRTSPWYKQGEKSSYYP